MKNIFDRRVLRIKRDRASPKLEMCDFLIKEAMSDVVERAFLISEYYEKVLDLGGRKDYFKTAAAGRVKYEALLQGDISAKMLSCSSDVFKICFDEESIPIADKVFDLVVSNLNMHLVNDVPGVLIQIKNILKEDGVFIGAFFGESTLQEIKKSFVVAEDALGIPVRQHVAPMIKCEQIVNLMKRAGFKNIVADSHKIEVLYKNPMEVLYELQDMGESGCLQDRVRYLSKTLLKEFLNQHTKLFSKDGGVVCTFEIVSMTGVR